ncbi:MAG: hypothetical protein RIF33_25105 [Cyclobacteriaceae bacterium]
MQENILLKKSPKIEFQLLDNGFQVIDEQTEDHSGYYAYNDLQSVELNNPWFPRFAKWLRVITCICNVVPFFPHAESYKKANIIFHDGKSKFGMWLTDSTMANQARKIKELLDRKVINSKA